MCRVCGCGPCCVAVPPLFPPTNEVSPVPKSARDMTAVEHFFADYGQLPLDPAPPRPTPTTETDEPMSTIYEQLGSGPGIRAVVDAFYDRLLADPELMHYFDELDLDQLRWHQAALLSTVTGGPAKYEGRELAAAHAHLNITAEDFMRVVGHLVAVLEAAGLASASIDAVVGALATHKDTIVTAPAVNGVTPDGLGR
jgi:hemoglobin